MSTPAPETIYLDAAGEPVCSVFHAPNDDGARDTAVILCPPFGWDEVCSYRSRRTWAQQLASAGYPAVRLSLPSTGDSGGFARDPGRVKAWTAAIASVACWTSELGSVRSVAAVGMGLGGLIAYLAATDAAQLKDLVLWGVPARGRALVRELRAFSRLEVSEFYEGLEPPPQLPSGELEAGGFLLSAETVQDLERLDLQELPLPKPNQRRVLLLERDGMGVDSELSGAIERSGAAVLLAPGDGYAAMTSHPQRARPATEVFARVTAWLGEGSNIVSSTSEHAAAPRRDASGSATMHSADGAHVLETPLTVPQPFGSLAGVLTEPVGVREPGLCTVLLNAGAVRRIGPSRMWVEAARRWAARGVATLRLDVEGIGDADGDGTPYAEDDGLYVPRLVPEVLSALDALQERGMGDRFMLVGLCAGAYWSFHAALRDPRVCAAAMLNPRALIWDPDLAPARDFRALFSQKRSWARIRRSATPARLRALAAWILSTPKRKLTGPRGTKSIGAGEPSDLAEAFSGLQASHAQAMFLFSAEEPLDEELERSGWMARIKRWPNVTVEHVAVRDHTMRANWAQRRVHEALDRALDRAIAAGDPEQSGTLTG